MQSWVELHCVCNNCTATNEISNLSDSHISSVMPEILPNNITSFIWFVNIFNVVIVTEIKFIPKEPILFFSYFLLLFALFDIAATQHFWEGTRTHQPGRCQVGKLVDGGQIWTYELKVENPPVKEKTKKIFVRKLMGTIIPTTTILHTNLISIKRELLLVLLSLLFLLLLILLCTLAITMSQYWSCDYCYYYQYFCYCYYQQYYY